jgi:hypothetical protein
MITKWSKESVELKKISKIQRQLIKESQYWALRQDFNAVKARELRQQAILMNHAYYLKNIPIYQKLAREECVGEETDIRTIQNKLMFADEIFKSYRQEWLENYDFTNMNRWLSNIYHRRVNTDVEQINSIDDWLAHLSTIGINTSFSSGTSGSFSFLPRDNANWDLVKTANTCYLSSLFTFQNIGKRLERLQIKNALKLLQPEDFAKFVGKIGFPEFDAFFLGFRYGRMGNQALIQELAPVFRNKYFLYEIGLTANLLLLIRRGPQSEVEERLIEKYQEQVSGQRDNNYQRILDKIRISTCDGQKVFIFGAPYQFKELCDFMFSRNQKIVLNKGSLMLFGGGWKLFTGEMMKRDELVKTISENFNLSPEHIMEGYSMTEISVLMLRCQYGRFHIPPMLEPVVFDEELKPLEGKDLNGTFGFLDPLAVTYPGFIITGDHVHLVDGECRCGLIGSSITEIHRTSTLEIKGCGGVMSTIKSGEL